MKRTFGRKIVIGSMVLALAVPSFAGATSQATTQTVMTDTVSAGYAETSKLVPIRKTLEYLGMSVDWEPSKRLVVINHLEQELVIDVNDLRATLNGQNFAFAGDIEYTDGVVYVPLNLVNEAFGLHIGWNSDQNSVTFAEKAFEEKANAFVAQWKSGNTAEAFSFFSNDLKAALPVELLAMQWLGVEQFYGEIGDLVAVSSEQNQIHYNVTLVYEAETMPFALTLRFTHNGLINDIFVDQGYVPNMSYLTPEYDNPENYTEQEVIIGEGRLALPGTLTLPKGDGPFPVVVLVHGSGAHDRDETIGGVKVFRDIAVGLAGQGIAVLRYEKLTREHPFKSHSETFTIQRETADDALSAVQLLSSMDQIDADRIYIAGHSQGAHMVPRMIELDQDNQIAGAVLLAGPAHSFQDVLKEQQLYLLELVEQLGLPLEQFKPAADFWIRHAEIINDPQYSHNNLPPDFALQPSYYWFEQRDYIPVEVARVQETPLLILQGENDWQVTMKQFEIWKKELAGKNHVQFKSYPKVNHLLTEYDQVSIGSEYMNQANVSKVLIEDIAKWIKGQ